MRLNIENCAKNGEPGHKEWALEELVRNLKEMRNRSNAGDMQAAVTEFFEVFRFNDGQGVAATTAPAPTEPVVPGVAAPMTAHRASFFMERFLKEEKLLGPNEQAALHFVIAMLATPPSAVEAAQPEAVGWKRVPVEPTDDMLNEGAQRLVSWGEDSKWPDSWDKWQVKVAKNEAERVWRSMWLAAATTTEAVRMSEAEIDELIKAHTGGYIGGLHFVHLCRAVEQATAARLGVKL